MHISVKSEYMYKCYVLKIICGKIDRLLFQSVVFIYDIVIVTKWKILSYFFWTKIYMYVSTGGIVNENSFYYLVSKLRTTHFKTKITTTSHIYCFISRMYFYWTPKRNNWLSCYSALTLLMDNKFSTCKGYNYMYHPILWESITSFFYCD